jgi:hypothetical protein
VSIVWSLNNVFVLFDRTEGTVRDKVTGAVFKTTKGAPHVILKLVRNFAVIAQVRICL